MTNLPPQTTPQIFEYESYIAAPKSVSLMTIITADKQILQAHEQAVAEVIAQLQRLAPRLSANQ